jgi:hypothetical protein
VTDAEKALVVAMIRRGLKDWESVAMSATSQRPEARNTVLRVCRAHGITPTSEELAALEAVGQEVRRLQREREGAEGLLAAAVVRALPELLKRLVAGNPSGEWWSTPDDVTAELAAIAGGTEALRWWRRALVATVGGPLLPGEDA